MKKLVIACKLFRDVVYRSEIVIFCESSALIEFLSLAYTTLQSSYFFMLTELYHDALTSTCSHQQSSQFLTFISAVHQLFRMGIIVIINTYVIVVFIKGLYHMTMQSESYRIRQNFKEIWNRNFSPIKLVEFPLVISILPVARFFSGGTTSFLPLYASLFTHTIQ